MNKIPMTINRVAAIIGLMLGAFALSAVAQWTPAPPNPPDGNVDAPLNASALAQTKIGSLKVGLDASNAVTGALSVGGLGVLSSNFIFKPSSANVPVGSVLTSKDTSGTVEWKTVAPPPPVCSNISLPISPRGTSWFRVTVPNDCINGMCSVVLKVYNVGDNPLSSDISALKVANLIQIRETGSAARDYWVKPGSVNDGTSCTYGRNGTTAGCDAIVNYNDQIVLYDDNANAESGNPDEWSFKDTYGDGKFGVLSVCR